MWGVRYLRVSSLGFLLVPAVIISLWVAVCNIKSEHLSNPPTPKTSSSFDILTSTFFSYIEEQSLDNNLSHEEKYKEFNTSIRTYVIYLITFSVLYLLSCIIISKFSKSRDTEYDFDLEEYMIYKISTLTCAFTLAISFAALLLLPASITISEVSWIVDTQTKWSLLNGLWGYVFLFSNISLFILLPFAYFLTESEGFAGSRRGIMSRLRETLVLLAIVGVIFFGMTYIICCMFTSIGCHINGILNIWQYLPFLYSCISFLGALLLLVCAPIGISHLFTNFHDLDKTRQAGKLNYTLSLLFLITLTAISVILALFNSIQLLSGHRHLPMTKTFTKCYEISDVYTLGSSLVSKQVSGENQDNECLRKTNGTIGTFFEIVMILYLWTASLCGLYKLPGFSKLKPRIHQCSFNLIVGNCAVLCLLTSALPLFSRTLGITDFDLLGEYGRIEWLGNFFIVLLFNLLFLISTALLLDIHRLGTVILLLISNHRYPFAA